MVIDILKIIGAVGLLLICIGIIIKKRKRQDLFYIFGGLLLLLYSIYIRDWVFIILQIVFTLSATYDLIKNLKKKK